MSKGRGAVMTAYSEHIKNGMEAVGYKPSRSEISTVLHKVKSSITAGGVRNPTDYAWCAGRNYALDQYSKQRGKAQREAKAKAVIKKAAKEAALQAEFEVLANYIASQHPRNSSKMDAIEYLCFHRGATLRELKEVFPNIPRDLVYKRKERGLKLLEPYASKALWRFLQQRRVGNKAREED